MLEGIRSGAKGPMGKVLVVVICLAFGLWGVSTVVPLVFSSGAPVTVNGEDISTNEIQRRVQQERQQLLQQLGSDVDPSMITEEMVRPQVIERLVQQRLVAQAAKRNEFVLSDRSVDRVLAREPAFQDQGRFSSEAFSRIAAQQGMTPRQLRDAIGDSEVTNQWVTGLQRTEFVLPHELQQYGEYSNQVRDIDYVILEAEDFLDAVDISDTDVAQYYDANQSDYTTPERVAVDYVVYPRERLEADVEPSEEEIEAAYQMYLDAEGGSAERDISHILITADDRSTEEARELAEELRQRAESEDFAELAETYSDDPGSASMGGNLGQFQTGVFVDAFEAAVQDMEEVGELSNVVETEFGFHIIRLDAIEFEDMDSLDDMRDQLRTELIEREIASQIPVIRDEIANIAFASLDLQELAEAFELDIESTELFSREGGDGIAANADVVSAAFSSDVLQEDLNSEVVALDDMSLVVLRKRDYEEPSVLPLEDVEDEIRTMLRQRAAIARAQEEAEALHSTLAAGESPNISLQPRTGITRFDETLADSLINEIFRAPAPEDEGSSAFLAETANGQWAVGRVTNVSPGEIGEDEHQQVVEFMQQNLRNAAVESVLTDLREQASIRVR
ncbi:MAG: SurA N-terminal domain-containing protein [Natronospirillum sp.]|uniref:SurA N-terminal domain-containing protein n=1 Tax=Natronospirillum sp. TaxID=2812955 RepID=UPI0025E673D6|nr:SurA N-terminal domain-containing protein [Natronospirillum sp.]MCH8552726.1 SurA N-terminal domain-containing protein [Natronospirillum sp.]